MLIEFIVSNFRSIRDEQCLSMVASPTEEHETTHVVDSGAYGAGRLLRTAVIYGANAAGKSNLLLALDVMQDIVVGSAKETQAGEKLSLTPFLFDADVGLPTKLEVTFVEDNVKYQYGFTGKADKIHEEWLIAYPERRPQRWFHRGYDESTGSQTWEFSHLFKGQKQAWRSQTRSNALFLSTAVQLNSEQLRPVFSWFQKRLRTVLGSGALSELYTRSLVASGKWREEIARFLKDADTGIEDCKVVDKNLDSSITEMIRQLPDVAHDRVVKQMSQGVELLHRRSNGEIIWLDLNDESQGTQKLFAYAGPILDVLKNGRVLLVDELNNSLHPLIAQKIVETFNSPEQNPNRAQLIFATHAASMLSLDHFRRDQIWFVEKNRQHASVLYPLTDFSPRKGMILSKGYLQGRFGAIPFVTQGLVAHEADCEKV